jgi:hypothetical protein
VSRSTENYDGGTFALDGKTRFGFSANAMYGTGWGIGGTITVFEKFTPNSFVAPSVFISAKYFAIDERKRFFAGGVGVLFKRRLTKNERLLLGLGLSLEYLAGEAEEEEDYNYYYSDNYSGPISLFGMGVQGGLSYRLTPSISLDINGLVKFGFGSAETEQTRYSCHPENHSYTPVAGGAEIGVSFMF